MKALIKVGYACNENCTFCHTADMRHIDDNVDRIDWKISRAKRLGYTRRKYCYLQNLCDTLDTVIDARKENTVEVLRFSGEAPIAGTLPLALAARIAGKTLDDAARLARVAYLAKSAELELELDDYAGLSAALAPDGTLFGKKLTRCYTDSPATMTELLRLDACFEVAVFLTRATEPAVLALGAPPSRLVLAQRNYDLVSDAHTHDVDTKAFFAAYTAEIPVENIPACILGRAPRPRPRTLDVAMLGSDARIDMTAYTQRSVADAYYTKALRCGTCSENAACRGVHVNWVRAHGFAVLTPLVAQQADADAAAAAESAKRRIP